MKLKKVNLTITRKNKQSYKTTLAQATVSELKSIARSLKLKGYSRLRKADLIDFILSEIYPMLPDLTNRANTLMGIKPVNSQYNPTLESEQRLTVLPFGPFMVKAFDLDEDGFIDYVTVTINQIEYFTLSGERRD